MWQDKIRRIAGLVPPPTLLPGDRTIVGCLISNPPIAGVGEWTKGLTCMYIRYFIFIGVFYFISWLCILWHNECEVLVGVNVMEMHVLFMQWVDPHTRLWICASIVYIRVFIALGDLCKQPNCGILKALSLFLAMHICIRDGRVFTSLHMH